MSSSNAFTLRDYLVIAVIAAVLGLALWLKVGPDFSGTVVDGEVVAKREAIEMPLEDTWRHTFEVSYRYQPRDQSHPAMARHFVDEALYDRLRVAAPVKVRYRPAPLAGAGFDSALADTSWWSRTPSQSESGREFTELAAFGFAAVIGFVAYRRRSRWLGVVAGTAAATVASAVLMFGFFVFPLLFWAWVTNTRKGIGWVLALSFVLTTAVIYYRVPAAGAPPSQPTGHVTAVVQGVHTVHRIWASSSTAGESTSGEPIRWPFEMVDLEFTPQGAIEPVHALDRVDVDSAPGLKQGVMVAVTYSLADPRTAQIVGGTRKFGRRAFVSLLGVTYGVGAGLAFGLFPAVYFIQRLARRSRALKVVFDPAERERLMSQLPPDDPRRKRLEDLLGSHRDSPRNP